MWGKCWFLIVLVQNFIAKLRFAWHVSHTWPSQTLIQTYSCDIPGLIPIDCKSRYSLKNTYITIERFNQLIPIVQSYWPAEIFLNTFKISLLLKPLQHWSGNLSLSIWNFWKIWVRWQSNFDSLPAVDELYFWYLDIHMYTCSQLKKMEFVPRSPKIKSDKKAACFIPNSKN